MGARPGSFGLAVRDLRHKSRTSLQFSQICFRCVTNNENLEDFCLNKREFTTQTQKRVEPRWKREMVNPAQLLLPVS